MSRIAICLLIFRLGLNAQPVHPGRIEGQTVDAITKQTVPRVTVILRGGIISPGPRVTLSDEFGRFKFTNLRPDTYLLEGLKTGYLLSPYGATNPNGLTLPVTLRKGRPEASPLLLMAPPSALSGKVLDADGDAAEGVQIEVQQRFPIHGKVSLVAAGKALSDERGAFRIAGLIPGRYYVVATWKKPRNERIPIQKSAMTYIPTYYPGVDQFPNAQVVDLWPGQELTTFRMRLLQRPAFRIRGKLAADGSGTEKSTLPVDTRMRPGQLAEPFLGVSVFPHYIARWASKDGTFTFADVPPGNYVLEAVDSRNGLRVLGRTNLVVSDSNLEGVEIPRAPLTGISVRLRQDQESGPLQFAVAALTMFSIDVPDTIPIQLARDGAGGFAANYLMPDRFQMMIRCEGAPCFIKSIRAGEQAQPGSILDLRTAKPLQVEIVVSHKVASLRGKVEKADDNRGWGSVVALRDGVVITVGRLGEPLSGAWHVSPGGGFSSQNNLLPGEYELFAVEALSPAIFDPEFLRRLSNKSVRVKLSEGDRKEVFLKLITIQDIEEAIQKLEIETGRRL